MQEKILTISIAAYNMENYICECLESLIVNEDVLSSIEVLVCDDGGADRSFEIAQRYEKEYPGIFYALHKENGGYGSVFNYTVKRATGKYFRLLDGDDKVDTKEFEKYVLALREINSDVVYTHYKIMYENNEKKIKIPELVNNDFDSFSKKSVAKMWSLTFKTRCLLESKVILPEKCLYTDVLLSGLPFYYVTTGITLDLYVYCYRVGRNGQSIALDSKIKHIDDAKKTCMILFDVLKNGGDKNLDIVKRRTALSCLYFLDTLLLAFEAKKAVDSFRKYNKYIDYNFPDIKSIMYSMGWKGKYLFVCNLLGCNMAYVGRLIRKMHLKLFGNRYEQ